MTTEKEKMISVLSQYLNYNIDSEEVISESYRMHINELDESLVIDNYLEVIKEQDLLIHFFMYRYYVGYIISGYNTGKSYLIGIINEDKLLYVKEL